MQRKFIFIIFDVEYTIKQDEKKLSQHQSDLQKKNLHQIQHKVIAIMIAVFAMFGYARSNGLLGVRYFYISIHHYISFIIFRFSTDLSCTSI